MPFEVKSCTSWAMSAKVAQRMTAGRIHLLGDAAHQFPPAGAFGANTGLQDAHNLCWKLAAVHGGAASPSLLGSYDSERRPVAVENARLSVHNYERGLRVTSALGLPSRLPHILGDAALALRRSAPALAHAVAGMTQPVGGVHGLGTALLQLGREQLITVLGHEASNPLARVRLDSARKVVESGAALPLLFARHELGYVYGEGAAVARGGAAVSRPPEPTVSQMEDEHYVPSTYPGARLPHHWLFAQDGSLLSTHDLLHERDANQPDATPPPPPPPPPPPLTATPSTAATSTATGDGVESLRNDERGCGAIGPLANGTAPRLTLFVDAAESGVAWRQAAASLAASQLLRVVAIGECARGRLSATSEGECEFVSDPSGGWSMKREVSASGTPCHACSILVVHAL